MNPVKRILGDRWSRNEEKFDITELGKNRKHPEVSERITKEEIHNNHMLWFNRGQLLDNKKIEETDEKVNKAPATPFRGSYSRSWKSYNYKSRR